MSDWKWNDWIALGNDRAELQAEVERLRRALDNIKVRGYELGHQEMHGMALTALQEKNDE